MKIISNMIQIFLASRRLCIGYNTPGLNALHSSGNFLLPGA